jgi:signal transduction histidine kinase
MNWRSALPKRSRAALVAGLTAAGMLLVAGLVLAGYDSQVYKSQKVGEVSVQARILAASVTAALEFEDAETVDGYLNALQANPDVDAAAVYGADGNIVASFARPKTRPVPTQAPVEQSLFDDTFLVVALPVQQEARNVGTVYMRVLTEPVFRRLSRYGGIVLLMTMASLAVAVMVMAHNVLSRANTQLKIRAAQLAATNEQLLVEIKEREKVEDALRQAQKMEAVGQLTGGIAHDFNNMLAVIVGNLSLLLRRAPQGETDLTQYAEGALEGASRGARLTQQLLAFSRQQPLAPVPLDPNKLVSGMSELLRRALGEHIRFETVIAGRIWHIHADKTQLETAILNLAVNARDAMPDGGTLSIETSNTQLAENQGARELTARAGDYVMIAVRDSGDGMAPDVVAKAFDPFFTTKPVGQGTGLGLSQVYGFVKQSRGHVEIESTVGRGTTVKLYLPRYMGEDSTAERNVRTPTALPAGRIEDVILVVEDDANVRRVTVDSLRDLGYTVLHADGFNTAMELVRTRPEVKLLFTDIVMPDGNGGKLAEEALETRSDLKVLFTTGYARDAILDNGVLNEGVQLLTKPYTIAQLAVKIREILG